VGCMEGCKRQLYKKIIIQQQQDEIRNEVIVMEEVRINKVVFIKKTYSMNAFITF